MMQPFLESLAIHLIRSAGSGLSDMRLILPNRRSGLFLQRHLAAHIAETTWLPRIYTISDFIDEMSSLELADPLDLFFTLYDIYEDTAERPESADEFYLWGEMMLRDFDEIDKYRVDAAMLFRNIVDLKELEEPLAGLEPEQLQFIRQFWTGFHRGEESPEKKQFLQHWIKLPVLYDRLRDVLTRRGLAYAGMQYREIADRAAEGTLDLSWKGKTIIAGFNALNYCEKQLFYVLQNRGAEFFWDFDHQYTDGSVKEAGRFLRENMRQFPAAAELEDFSGLKSDREYHIYELPTDVLQAKMVHRILEEKDAAALQDFKDTAVVLCDEELLIPLMMSLPVNIGHSNVTMGYPMKNTQVYSFIDTLSGLQRNMRKSSAGKVRFYHKDVLAILLHPYFRKLQEESADDLAGDILRKNLVAVDREFFSGVLEKAIFRPVEGTRDFIAYLRTLFDLILGSFSGTGEEMEDALERAFIFHMLTRLNKLETIVEKRPALSTSILERFLKKLVGVLRIPFEGEPLSGLQIMGILETRLLDFKHVILLSMNEEVMPAAHSVQSNIPYTLRLAFGMPAKEDKDAIYAYYFHRLLQRAKRVDLLYNGGTDGIQTGEMSRYIHQLVFERELKVIRPGLELRAREILPLVIPHNRVADQKLAQYLKGGEEEKYLSPSAVNTYIDCSLKFYLRYIARIGEPDEISEDMDAAGFGSVVHDALAVLYSEIADRNEGQVSREELSRLLSAPWPEEVLRNIFLKQHFKGRIKEELEGRNIIIFSVMLRYLMKIIQRDLAIAPFELVSAEVGYRRSLEVETGSGTLNITLGGKIDRLDRVDGMLRVIDYKTGQTLQNFTTLESLFDPDYGSRNGAAMQTLFYAWLVGEAFPGEEVMPGLYTMKGIFEDEFDPALKMTSLKSAGRITSLGDHEAAFLSHLQQVLQELYDPDIPFVQRKDDKVCSHCDFAGLCRRGSGD